RELLCGRARQRLLEPEAAVLGAEDREPRAFEREPADRELAPREQTPRPEHQARAARVEERRRAAGRRDARLVQRQLRPREAPACVEPLEIERDAERVARPRLHLRLVARQLREGEPERAERDRGEDHRETEHGERGSGELAEERAHAATSARRRIDPAHTRSRSGAGSAYRSAPRAPRRSPTPRRGAARSRSAARARAPPGNRTAGAAA